MARTVLFTCIILFVGVNSDEIPPELKCILKPCFLKCCPPNQYYDADGNCTDSAHPLNYSDIDVYDSNIKMTDKKVVKDIELIPISDFNTSFDITFSIRIKTHNIQFNIYLLENGACYLEMINALLRWKEIKPRKFCIEYSETETDIAPMVFVDVSSINEDVDEEENDNNNWEICLTYGLLVSCLCLLVVLVVYGLLPELRNLGGMILMAYAGSLLASYLCLFSLRFSLEQQSIEDITCYVLTFLIYFWGLASFFWMNVMSFDIWWTFRGYAKSRPIHRRGENFKFLMYALYAFGVPLLITGAVIYLFLADLSYTPWIIKPIIPCFFADDEKMLYLYMPMLFLILWNWVFFLLTAYNVWRLSRNVASVLKSAAAGRPSDHQQQRNRLMVYLKLSVVMGVSWVLEVLCYFVREMKYIQIQDIYHSLIGLVIMLIFICKTKIIKKIIYKLRKIKHPKLGYSKRSSISTSDSDVSQEVPLQICSNPKGLQHSSSLKYCSNPNMLSHKNSFCSTTTFTCN